METISNLRLKDISTELAKLLASGHAKEDLSIQMFEELAANYKISASLPVHVNREAPTDSHVGIWKKIKNADIAFFERDSAMSAEWPLWSSQHRIYPKKNKKRIVLLGESVARGYFYDPYYNVSTELESILNKNSAGNNNEVIDLAQTSQSYDGLRQLITSCTQLDPDTVIIFAGNNWIGTLYKSLCSETYDKMLQAFRSESVHGLRKYLELHFSNIIVDLLSIIQSSLIRKNIPVIFVIPGFNIMDWRSDPVGKNLPWLPDDNAGKWLAAKEKAQNALDNDDPDSFERSCKEMIGLDAFNPLPYEWLADHYIAGLRWAEARSCLSRGRDTVIINRGGNNYPRCLSVIAETIINHSPHFGITPVDLNAFFDTAAPHGISDRSIYLDYCHLTVGGIKLAMQHVAATLIPVLYEELPIRRIEPSEQHPEDSVLSAAHLCAAIHNAHNGQSYDIVKYHCEKAIKHDPDIKHAMIQYIDFATRRSSTILCKSFEDIIKGGKMRQYEGGFALRPPQGRKLLDVALIDAMSHSLKAVYVHMETAISQLRLQEHQIGAHKTDLLQACYISSTYLDFVNEETGHYLQARNTTTEISFVSDGSHDILFAFTYRTPNRYCPDRRISITANQNEYPVMEIAMSNKWKNEHMILPKKHISPGVNKIVFTWPYTFEPFRITDQPLNESSFQNALVPVLGEINSLTAVAV
ncbi:MAG TPA: hypothetical protein VNS58_17145 [Puia sp.]|nr:hypothetical protein [Puia sp.]